MADTEKLKVSRVSRLLLGICVAFAGSAIVLPDAFGQQDVHAVLVAKAERKPAPKFQLVSDTGKLTSVSTYRGKVVVLNFWATKCGGCVLEIPSFIELEKTYGNAGLRVVGVSEDVSYSGLKNAEAAWRQVRPFMASHKMNYAVLMGNDAVVSAYGFDEYPATYVIDRSGRIAATYVGVVDKGDVEAKVRALLAER
jgi:peroxiredoxin